VRKLWFEKYRPTSIDEYVWISQDFREKFKGWVAEPDTLPNLILHGPSGTGKTTLAKLLKIELGIENEDFLYLPGSRNSGIETVRGQVTEFCENQGWNGLRLVVYDEAERLTRDAQEGLRDLTEIFTDSVRFIFTCNDIRRIVPALQGRCLVQQIQALDQEAFLSRLVEVALAEGINIEQDENQEVLATISDQFYPNLRKALVMLQDAARGENLVYVHHDQADNEMAMLIFGQITSNAPVGEIKNSAYAVPRDEIEDIYRYLYESSSSFGPHEEKAIRIIAEHIYRHALVGLTEINLCDALIRLRDLAQEG